MDTAKYSEASITATQELSALLEISKKNRQVAWHHRLITCLPQALFTSAEPEIIFNPAGFTYYNLKIATQAEKEDDKQICYTLPKLIDSFLIREGVGIAIEAQTPQKAIDLAYGDVLGFHLYHTFAEPKKHPFKTDKPRAGMVRAGSELVINEVPNEILPAVSISLLHSILQHLKVKTPEIKLLHLPETAQNELVFSVDGNQFSQSEQQALIQKLGWFLPRYYSYLVCDLDNIAF